jgi:hypothetical protein
MTISIKLIFMKCFLVLTSVSLLGLFCSCKKDNTDRSEQRKDQFSFVYNGATYNFSISNNVANAGVSKRSDHTASMIIDMPAIFGGRIYFTQPTCAYLEPGNTIIYDNYPTCQLSIKNSYGDPEPIDSALVYIYQSGSLNISFSNCVMKTETDIYTGDTNQYEVCLASGTFDLVLINKNNNTIKITNGIVNQYVR